MFFIIKKLSLIFLLLTITIVNSNSNIEEINKIDKQIESIDNLFKAGAMDNEEYDKIKSRLLIKKNKLKNQNISEISEENKNSITLNKQIEVLSKLLKMELYLKRNLKNLRLFYRRKKTQDKILIYKITKKENL